jgi:hypothetical protein
VGRQRLSAAIQQQSHGRPVEVEEMQIGDHAVMAGEVLHGRDGLVGWQRRAVGTIRPDGAGDVGDRTDPFLCQTVADAVVPHRAAVRAAARRRGPAACCAPASVGSAPGPPVDAP